jgi:hypothetical protein
MAGAAGLVIGPALAQTGTLGAAEAYIAPGGSGDGLSVLQPAGLDKLGELVKTVGPGGTIYILADRGDYQRQPTVEIAAGGTAEAPVRIVGADARRQPARAVIRGNRKRWRKPLQESRAIDAGEFGGDPTFVFGTGASHLAFSNVSFVDTGRIFDFTGRRESGIVIEDIDFLNVRDGLFTNEDSELSNVTIRRFSGVGFSKKAIRVHGKSHGWLIEDCELDSGWQFGDDFAVGIELNHTANDIAITGGFTINCLDTQDGDKEKYWNADGIAAERDNYNIRISDHRSAGHSDGGYDLKSEDTVLTRCIAEDNKRNYRIWGGQGAEPLLLEDCQSITPRSRGGTGAAAHLWLPGVGDAGDISASAIFKGGAMIDAAPGSAAIYADGNSIIVHLIDADLSGLGERETLVEGEGQWSTVIVGSAADADLSQIATDSEISTIEGFSKTVPLVADGEASWRIVDTAAADGFTLLGSVLTVTPAPAGSSSTVIVQARGSNGVAIQKELRTDVVANPVGAGTALAVNFVGDDGTTTAEDRTGLNLIEFAGEASIQGGAVRFNRGEDFITVADSDNFSFDGPFTIDTEFMLDNPMEEGGQDVVSHWGDASRQRGYVIRCEETGILVFAWTYDGSDKDVSWIEGPVLEAGRFYKVRVDRDEAGTVRLYVDGRMAGSKADSGQPILNSAVPLRISGRADGKYGANGQMRSLLINSSYALTGSDSGYSA